MEDNYLKQLYDIREMMSKSTRFLSLSGLTGIIAGVLALAGAITAHFYLQSIQVSNNWVSFGYFHMDLKVLIVLTGIAGTVFLFSLLSAVILGLRKSKKEGVPFFTPVAYKMAINLAIPMVFGALFCIQMLYYGLDLMIPGGTLLFYGLGLVNASKYTIGEVRYLGLILIILGIITGFFLKYSILFWGFGFGVLHIVYGIIMYIKYDKNRTS